ncbi:MAG TPA: MaoC family dehydratase [Xanthobacteraceae bacterium]|jgi:acyl dehydratase|nr:MaoC family dehydratase [Xanthobacteraceae bacterium]
MLMRRGHISTPRFCWEDFHVGHFGRYGPWRMSAAEIKAFAAEFDPQPMHLDEDAARATLMGGLCASGWHTCAVMMRMIADGFLLESSSMGGPGCEEIRWLAPVRPGDDLFVDATVLETRASKSRSEMGFVKFLFQVRDATGRTVMALTTNLMFARRHAPQDAEAGA